MKIIVAEDDKDTARLLKTILSHFDYEVVTVSNGFQLLDYLNRNDDIHIVITDLDMPKIDGITATNIIKNHLNPKLPIIGITGTSEHLTHQETLDKLLFKPLNINELVEIINTFDTLKRRNSHDEDLR